MKLFWMLAMLFVFFAGVPAKAIARLVPTSAKADAPKTNAQTRRINNTVDFIEQNLIHLQMGFWGSKIVKNKKKYGIGLTTFGAMRELFFEDRIATGHYDKYRTFFATGFTLTLIGTAALIVDIVLLSISPQMINTTGGLVATMSLLLSGTVFGLIGAILIGVASNHLMRAVETYNQGIFSRARKGRWRVTFNLLPQAEGFTAGIAHTF